MCKALLPGDDDILRNDAIWETLPMSLQLSVAISMVFFGAVTVFTLLKLSESVEAECVLTRIHILHERLDSTLATQHNEIIMALKVCMIESRGKGNLKPHPLMLAFEEIHQSKLHDGAEAIVQPPWVALVMRLKPDVWEYVRVNVNALVIEEMTVPEYLHFKELVDGTSHGNFVLELDYERL
ncbi:hypothetical protein M8C21_030295 [Ambrosia artemisiifolia]|uniref:sucrose synthase n=1 Tax=Ambrosia artemisiifolia TaxID=4212 RepID=A0AAD5GAB3_AMBAR|nr:hypothetical protein M8C21_030295 [Ambrosia artemisiifolia]